MDRHQLEQVLRRVDPSVRLVNERHLRRGLRRLADAGQRVSTGLEHAHRLSRAVLEGCGEFPKGVADGDGETRLLLVEPGDRIADDLPDAEILRVYWELLFEAAVVEKLLVAGGDRWAALGETETAEAQFRLRRAQVLPPDPTPAEQYAAFVGEYLTLLRFAPEVLEYTYPSIHADAVGRLAARDLNADDIAARTRPDGAADPGPRVLPVPPEPPSLPPQSAESLHHQATRAAATGNVARAAVLRTRANDPAAAVAVTEGLVPKLAAIFGWDGERKQAWAEALTGVLPAAARGYWSPAAMGLHDLQKIPLDLSRELYVVDVGDWGRSLFRRPLVRKLSLARRAVKLRHLLAARKHFARVPAVFADPLLLLLDVEIADADTDLRHALRSKIKEALAPLAPRSVPELVARDTVAEELIDTIRDRGYARLADLRDAVARHAVKLDDLAGPVEFVKGDALLRADAALGVALDGLYRPGEAYLRLIQRGSSLAFGTTVGRWLMKFVAVPFGGAVMTVEFGKYLWHELGLVYGFVSGLVGDLDGDPTPPEPHPEPAKHEHHSLADQFNPPTVAAILFLGVFFLGLLHSRPFRAQVGRVFRHLWTGLKWAFVRGPLWVWNCPPVRAVRTHPATLFVADRLGFPFLAGAGVWLGLLALKASYVRAGWWGLGVFVGLAVVLNTPPGRLWQDRLAEWLSDFWRLLRRNLIPGIMAFFTWLFRELVGAVDHALYSVDEWLRFRQGQSKPSLAGKVAVALLWFPLAYVVRFAFYLLIEPQVNPVKHFPVVTVSHKLLLPMIPSLATATGLNVATVTGLIWGVPGIFGFIVWELKENWRLYSANRPRRLAPLAIGSHGETVSGLLTPGFHSGTVPAAFEKARAALVRERHTGRVAKVRKAADALHHAEDAVRRLIDRELLALPRTAKAWHGLSARVGVVHLGLQRITAEVWFDKLGPRPTVVEFARVAGKISGRVTSRGELDRLTTEQQAVWNHAMRGLLAKGCAADGPAWAEWVAFWDRQAT